MNVTRRQFAESLATVTVASAIPATAWSEGQAPAPDWGSPVIVVWTNGHTLYKISS